MSLPVSGTIGHHNRTLGPSYGTSPRAAAHRFGVTPVPSHHLVQRPDVARESSFRNAAGSGVGILGSRSLSPDTLGKSSVTGCSVAAAASPVGESREAIPRVRSLMPLLPDARLLIADDACAL